MAKKFEHLQAPDALRGLRGWLVWHWRQKPGSPKPSKMPYYVSGKVRTGTHGSEADRANLATFEEAKAFAEKNDFAGVGLALMPEFGITALDFDNCVKDGVIDPRVEELTAGTYAELSPSGNGIRAFVMGASPDHKDSTPEDGSFGFETFHAKGFVTFTGHVTELTEITGAENTVAPLSDKVVEFCGTRFKRAARVRAECVGAGKPTFGMSPEQITELLSKLPDDLHYEDWRNVGMAVHHETEGEGFDIWHEWSMNSPKYSSQEYCQTKWNSFGINTSADYTTMGTVMLMIRETGGETGLEVATADEFEDLGADKSKPRGHHGFFSIEEFEGQSTKVDWFIKGFLPRAQLAILFGPSGSGKSFLAFDMCAAISQGLAAWNGKRVMKGRIAYLVAEGVPGFRQRIKAYRKEHNVSAADLDMTIIAGVVPNLTDEASVARLKADMKAFGPYDLIVFDTFAQVTSGANENSGEEMSTALKHCREISQVCGAMSLLVHHSGKDDTKGARGWSGLKAAADVELEVKRDKDGAQRSVSITKMKDGEDGIDQGFSLRTVVMGHDEDGDEITSCVVEYNGAGKVEQHKVRMGTNQKIIMRCLNDLLGFNSGDPIKETDLIAAAVEMMPIKEGARQDMRSTRAKEALDALICNKCVSAENGMIRAGSDEM
jgi:hypothetical protein